MTVHSVVSLKRIHWFKNKLYWRFGKL